MHVERLPPHDESQAVGDTGKEEGTKEGDQEEKQEKGKEEEKGVDIDECKDPNSCPAKQKCINTPGAYECHCEEGYEKGDGDECVKMKCKCGAHGSKCDEDGKCTCNEGYEKNGEGVCTECKCASHEECFNGKCRCKTGYKKNSKGMCARKRSARQVDSGHSVHVTSHLGTLGLI
ncbi:fibrillin-1-like [Pocillopora damicornis]|uniref:fibrillin-1-like n=1 Tax=Pocillopora damicornis TaxID=46731 RepID=UPI000F550C1F|nr:fibrillin-1-like [Pocillopora damicornis]